MAELDHPSAETGHHAPQSPVLAKFTRAGRRGSYRALAGGADGPPLSKQPRRHFMPAAVPVVPGAVPVVPGAVPVVPGAVPVVPGAVPVMPGAVPAARQP